MDEQSKRRLELAYWLVVAEWGSRRRLDSPAARDAVKDIERAQKKYLTTILRGRVPDPEAAAAEVLSEWWEWAVRKYGGFEVFNPSFPILWWMNSHLRYKALTYVSDRFRGRHRRKSISDDLEARGHAPGDLVLRAEESGEVHKAVDELPEKSKVAIVERFWNGESSKETAEKFGGTPEDYDRARYCGKAILRKRLRGYMRDGRRPDRDDAA